MKPIDILKHAVNPIRFETEILEALGVKNAKIPSLAYRKLNLVKFGEYFMKATGGTLNSIIKRDTPTDGSDIEYIVKDRLGFRLRNGSGNFNGNGRYANNSKVFECLDVRHLPLICKKDKRAIAKDFLAVKLEMQAEFKAIEALAMDFVESEITVSNVFVIAHKRPNDGSYAYSYDGFMSLSPRIIHKDNISIKLEDTSNSYGTQSLREFGFSRSESYNSAYVGTLQLSAEIREVVTPNNVFDEAEFKTLPIFDVALRGVYPASDTNTDIINVRSIPTTVFDTYFNGVDIPEMISVLGARLDGMHSLLDTKLEVLKEKYSAEFVMYEICNGNSAI